MGRSSLSQCLVKRTYKGLEAGVMSEGERKFAVVCVDQPLEGPWDLFNA